MDAKDEGVDEHQNLCRKYEIDIPPSDQYSFPNTEIDDQRSSDIFPWNIFPHFRLASGNMKFKDYFYGSFSNSNFVILGKSNLHTNKKYISKFGAFGCPISDQTETIIQEIISEDHLAEITIRKGSVLAQENVNVHFILSSILFSRNTYVPVEGFDELISPKDKQIANFTPFFRDLMILRFFGFGFVDNVKINDFEFVSISPDKFRSTPPSTKKSEIEKDFEQVSHERLKKIRVFLKNSVWTHDRIIKDLECYLSDQHTSFEKSGLSFCEWILKTEEISSSWTEFAKYFITNKTMKIKSGVLSRMYSSSVTGLSSAKNFMYNNAGKPIYDKSAYGLGVAKDIVVSGTGKVTEFVSSSRLGQYFWGKEEIDEKVISTKVNNPTGIQRETNIPILQPRTQVVGILAGNTNKNSEKLDIVLPKEKKIGKILKMTSGVPKSGLQVLNVTNPVTEIIQPVAYLGFTSYDFYKYLRSKISGVQFWRNVSENASSYVGMLSGSYVGGFAGGFLGGSVVGSVVPIIGTGIGGIVGSIIGSASGSYVGGKLTKKGVKMILDKISKADGDILRDFLEVCADESFKMCRDNKVGKKEIENLREEVGKRIIKNADRKKLREEYFRVNKDGGFKGNVSIREYARGLLKPCFKNVI